jgi:hypothetical protein
MGVNGRSAWLSQHNRPSVFNDMQIPRASKGAHTLGGGGPLPSEQQLC